MASISAGTHPRAGHVALPVPNRTVLVAAVAGAVLAGFAVAGWGADAPRMADGELTHLLRMMAVLKLVLALGAAFLVDWRLRQPVGPRAVAAYVAGAGMMAAGPGLIWGLAHLVLGAVLFHAGVAMLLVLACKDENLRVPRPR